MTTTSQPSYTRFPRVGFNFGRGSQSELHNRAQNTGKKQDDDDWYIPYTGTYEPPPQPQSPRNKNRDSWGDPIYDMNTADTFGGGPHVHYDDDSSDNPGFRSSEESRVRGRHRTQSVSSNYSASTGIDHGRADQSPQKQYPTNSYHHKLASSYTNPGTGGVGESPVPHVRQPKDRTLSHRGSFASIFTFGIKQPSSPPPAERATNGQSRKRPSRPSTSSGADRPSNSLSSTVHRRTTSGDSNSHSIRAKRGVTSPLQSVESRTTGNEDYYQTYYSTLLPVKPRLSVDPLSLPDPPPTKSPSPASQHPYALAFSQTDNDRSPESPTQLKSASPSSQNHQPSLIIPKLTFSLSQSAAQPKTAVTGPSHNTTRRKPLKTSVSTPNLKAAKNTLGASRNMSKGIDRWLSAETWCDALLFPRPRLKIKDDRASSGRIVSPPGSPVLPSGPGETPQKSVPSRVLAHTRSLTNLREKVKEEEFRNEESQGGVSLPSPPTASQAALQPQATTRERERTDDSLRPPRPKSWASDDLDLPSPVPSLAKVLADGERLESDRKEWKSKAAGSLGNERARSISRSRSKSLTAKGRKAANQTQSNMNYLAARAVHGNQDVIPVLPSMPKHKRLPSSRQGTDSHSHSRNTSNAHTQSSSGIRSWTHSPKSHSRNHSRDDSWSKTVMKAVTPTAVYLNDDGPTIPTDEKNVQQYQDALEITPQQNDTQIIPIVPVSSPSPQLRPLGVSPTPSNTSGVSDAQVGIAISSPLMNESLDREHLRLPSHPYAHGGLYSYSPTGEDRVEYAGPHPVQNVQPADIPDGPAARHRLPPQVILSHPYAQAQADSPSRDSYDARLIHHPRTDSNVPPHAKMWAPVAPGVVGEILPSDLKYSPLIQAEGKLEGDMAVAMAMSGIVDAMSVEEALVYATDSREREVGSARDSGLGTSENLHASGSGSRLAEFETADDEDTTMKLGLQSRVPVQYTVTRPSYRLHSPYMQKTPDTLHTFASSPLEHHFTPRIPDIIREEMGTLAAPVINRSDTSSQRNSPRPLGSPNDLVGFQDLFYTPGIGESGEPRRMPSFGDLSWNGSQTRLSNIPFDLKTPYTRPASGLTTLTRKLSEEYEMLSGRGRSESQYSQSSSSGATRPPTTRRPTDASLEFVFERLNQGVYDHEPASTGPSSLPFGPRENVPEDVNSMSSMETGKELEDESENETEVLHVKQVEAVSPTEIDAEQRLSYAGQVGYETERHDNSPRNTVISNSVATADHEGHLSLISSPTSQGRVLSGQQAPLSDNTRSSYITTSTGSRMSGLSDFPVPPSNHRMSLLSAFFADVNGRPSISREDEPSVPLPSRTFNSNNRLTFGAGADAEEIVEALSNHPNRI